jgi:hypothetical protein
MAPAASPRQPPPADATADEADEARRQVEAFAERPTETREILLRVAEILDTIQYGTVLLVVQDSKVVQIEMAEKYRLR